jgi:hypothetical protein
MFIFKLCNSKIKGNNMTQREIKLELVGKRIEQGDFYFRAQCGNYEAHLFITQEMLDNAELLMPSIAEENK